MGMISDIQRSLEEELSILAQSGFSIRTFLDAGMKAVDRLGAQSSAGEPIRTYLSAAAIFSSYNAFVVFKEGEPGEAARLIVRSWQDCVRQSKECPVSALDPTHLLEFQGGVADFLDAEVRFGTRY
jgi:hypothetical protein